MSVDCRFALYDYNGDAKTYYLVQRKEILPDASTVAPEVTHHIFLVDRSGSMYYDLEALKATLEKVLTLAEYKDSTMLATVISYSSSGDYTVHFSRKTVAEIMTPGSAEVEAIRKLRVTGLTCISQAIDAAKTYIKPGETTGISLHSDGYANDKSPATERREIDRLCGDLSKMPGVFVNTIAYSSYSDFKLLAQIANSMNGKCIQATSIKEVFDALHDTSSLLSGRMAPAIQVPLDGADYFAFVSHSANRVNGSSYDTILLGLKPEDDKVVYWFTEVSETEYLDSGAPVAREGELLEPLYAFAMAKLAEGQLNTAKFALISTRDSALIPTHYRALTAPALAAFYADLQTVLFSGTHRRPQLPQYGLGLHKKPLIGLLTYLDQHKADLELDLTSIWGNYQRQGIKRAAGEMGEDGQIVGREISTRFVGDSTIARVGGFDLNNNTASINVLCIRPIQIFRASEGEDAPAITEVEGIKLDGLTAFNNYTVVSDGALNIPEIRLRIANKRVHRQLQKDGVFIDSSDVIFDPAAWSTIRLDDLPMVDFAQPFRADLLTGTFVTLARVKSLVSLLSALLATKSDRFTPEQIKALEDHDISKSLYHNPPTTKTYADKTDALNAGLLDTRVSFKIDIGSTDPQILSRGQLHSGNAMLKRFYTVTVDGKNDANPKWPVWWEDNVTFSFKTLSSRTKITPIDELMRPIYDEFLGLGASSGKIHEMLLDAELEADTDDFFTAMNREADRDDAVEVFTDALKALQRYADDLFDARVRPLVFYIGSTGLLPDELDTPALTAEQLSEKYPSLKIGTNEREGTFFVLEDGTLLSIYAKSVTFSVDRQQVADIEAAK